MKTFELHSVFSKFEVEEALHKIPLEVFAQFSPCLLAHSPGVGRHSAVEQEGLVIPEEILLEDLGHHEAVLHLPGPGVLVIRGEASQLLETWRIRSTALASTRDSNGISKLPLIQLILPYKSRLY